MFCLTNNWMGSKHIERDSFECFNESFLYCQVMTLIWNYNCLKPFAVQNKTDRKCQCIHYICLKKKKIINLNHETWLTPPAYITNAVRRNFSSLLDQIKQCQGQVNQTTLSVNIFPFVMYIWDSFAVTLLVKFHLENRNTWAFWRFW